jgi:hypothetical protein
MQGSILLFFYFTASLHDQERINFGAPIVRVLLPFVLSNRAAIECRLGHPEYTGVKIQLERAVSCSRKPSKNAEKSKDEFGGQAGQG